MEKMTHLTANEAAVLLDVSAQTVKRWIQEKKFEGYKYRNRWYVDTQDSKFQDFLALAPNTQNHHTEHDQHNQHVDHIDTPPSNSQSQVDKSTEPETLADQLQLLEKQLAKKDAQLDKRDTHIDELLKQQDQAQQLSAMQQKTIDRLTEQNQQLSQQNERQQLQIEDMSRNRSILARIREVFIPSNT
ncbi:TPA: helix-turn-helix domain-containing protein [Candidatus Poribacteria bacterium]|nr:helix-turn-helix domain-containing protein [Candidatus Poribacteria bacterium]